MDFETVRTIDGRVLEVLDCGDRNGQPVLVHHGTPQSRRVVAHADDAARAVGVRLMAYTRPGFGGSTFADPSLTGGVREHSRSPTRWVSTASPRSGSPEAPRSPRRPPPSGVIG